MSLLASVPSIEFRLGQFDTLGRSLLQAGFERDLKKDLKKSLSHLSIEQAGLGAFNAPFSLLAKVGTDPANLSVPFS